MNIKTLLLASMLMLGGNCLAQKVINLPKPDMQRKTTSVMQAFKERKSTREYDTKMLSDQDLSDLLWATQGKNRENGNLTAPTAMNKQEIRVYVFTEKNVTFYDPKANTLTQVAEGDHRGLIAGFQEFAKAAPVSIVFVGDMDKFGSNNASSLRMVCMDAGIANENLNLFCAAAGLVTVPRASMDQKGIQTLLGLNENQIPLLNNPVGYPKK